MGSIGEMVLMGAESDSGHIASRDDRSIVTPDAFRVAPDLIGTPLARPWRRAVAFGIDGLMVAILANQGGYLLAIGIAALIYVLGHRWKLERRWSRWLHKAGVVFASLCVFVVAGLVLQPLWDRYANDSVPAEDGEGFFEGMATAMSFGALSLCDDAACRLEAAQGFAEAATEHGLAEDDILGAVADFADEHPTEREALLAAAASGVAAADPSEMPVDEPVAEPAVAGPRRFSMLDTIKTLASDLGLGLGWGALYFTVFPVWWNGATPGKRLLGIRVVHLSGRPLRYWGAFLRYGGYAAGLATGLLGFFQVFWDANRQAVQDKIGFTAVIAQPGKTPLGGTGGPTAS